MGEPGRVIRQQVMQAAPVGQQYVPAGAFLLLPADSIMVWGEMLWMITESALV